MASDAQEYASPVDDIASVFRDPVGVLKRMPKDAEVLAAARLLLDSLPHRDDRQEEEEMRDDDECWGLEGTYQQRIEQLLGSSVGEVADAVPHPLFALDALASSTSQVGGVIERGSSIITAWLVSAAVPPKLLDSIDVGALLGIEPLACCMASMTQSRDATDLAALHITDRSGGLWTLTPFLPRGMLVSQQHAAVLTARFKSLTGDEEWCAPVDDGVVVTARITDTALAIGPRYVAFEPPLRMAEMAVVSCSPLSFAVVYNAQRMRSIVLNDGKADSVAAKAFDLTEFAAQKGQESRRASGWCATSSAATRSYSQARGS